MKILGIFIGVISAIILAVFYLIAFMNMVDMAKR